MTNVELRSIECDMCHTKFEYESEQWLSNDGFVNEDVMDMPDGYFHETMWICDECGSCKYCGKSLEKLPEQRGKNNSKSAFSRCSILAT